MNRRNAVLLAALFAVIAVIVGSALVTLQNMRAMRNDDVDVRRVLRTVTAMREVYLCVQEAETAERGFLIDQDPAEFIPYKRAVNALQPRFAEVKKLLADYPDQLARLSTLQTLALAQVRQMNEILALAQSGARDDAFAKAKAEDVRAQMDQLRLVNNDIVNVALARLGQTRSNSRQAYDNARVSSTIAALLALLLTLATALIVLRERRHLSMGAAQVLAEKERFRITLRSIGDGVVVANRRGQIEYLNPIAEELTGWGEEAVGQDVEKVFSIISETTRASLDQPIRQVLDDRASVANPDHALLVHRDGSERPIEDSAAPILDTDGQLRGVVLVFRDASDKRRITRALQRSESEYRALFDEAGVGNANLSSHDGRLTRVNRRLVLLTGYEPEELLRLSLYELFVPQARHAVTQIIEELREGRSLSVVREAALLRKDGEVLETRVSANVVRGDEGIDPAILVMFEDVSEARFAIEALRESEMRLRIVLENVIAFVLLMSVDGTVMQVNGVAREIGGKAADEMLGRKLGESFSFNYDKNVSAGVATAIAQAAAGHTVRADLRARVSPGVYITIDASLAPVYDGSKEPTFLVASGIDISQRKAVEEELQRSDRRKDEFLAMLGHELRNPLAPIATAIALIKTTEGKDAKVLDQALGVLQRQSEHLSSLVNDLLDVARFTSGKISLRLEVLDIEAPLGRAIELSEDLFRARRQHFTVDLPKEPLFVLGDLHRLTQIFGNLLNNASKYSETGARIDLSAKAQGDQVVVSVVDTGMGIGAAILPHVFELFTQSERALDRAQGGLGIGLTLVKRLVELHEGHVTAASEGAGFGSTFTVSLLRADPQAPKSASSVSATAETLRLKVLVVDDNRDAAETLAELLRLLGHEVTCAYDGPSALSVAGQLAPDAVVLDIGLPGMSGLEVAGKLRNLAETRSAQLIAVTGYGQSEDHARSQSAGFDAHLVKPIDADEIGLLLASRVRHVNRSG